MPFPDDSWMEETRASTPRAPAAEARLTGARHRSARARRPRACRHSTLAPAAAGGCTGSLYGRVAWLHFGSVVFCTRGILGDNRIITRVRSCSRARHSLDVTAWTG